MLRPSAKNFFNLGRGIVRCALFSKCIFAVKVLVLIQLVGIGAKHPEFMVYTSGIFLRA